MSSRNEGRKGRDGDNPIISNYRELFRKYGRGPRVGQWSAAGQRFRFEKLLQIGDFRNRSVLDVGCGIADLYPTLRARFKNVNYMGIDLVPELIHHAEQRYPEARFKCHDLVLTGLAESFDYVLISGVFNNRRPHCTRFMKQLLTAAFKHCIIGLGFNFASTYVNFKDDRMAYHDPVGILKFCIEELSRKTMMHHHYERCDAVVFAYK